MSQPEKNAEVSETAKAATELSPEDRLKLEEYISSIARFNRLEKPKPFRMG
jgi:hypothetical protein